MANLRPLRKFLRIVLEAAFPGTAVTRWWRIYSGALLITVEPNQCNTRNCCHLTPAIILNTNQRDLLKLDLLQFYSFHSFPNIPSISHPLRVRVTCLTSLPMALLVTHCCGHILHCSPSKAMAHAVPHLDHPPLKRVQALALPSLYHHISSVRPALTILFNTATAPKAHHFLAPVPTGGLSIILITMWLNLYFKEHSVEKLLTYKHPSEMCSPAFSWVPRPGSRNRTSLLLQEAPPTIPSLSHQKDWHDDLCAWFELHVSRIV